MKDRDQPLSGHLEELRKRVLYCVIPFLALLPVMFALSPAFLAGVFGLCEENACSVYLMGVTDALLLRIRAALLMTILALLPLLTVQTLLFVFPGLYRRERAAVLTAGALLAAGFSGGVILFLIRLAARLLQLWLRAGNSLPPMLSALRFYDAWLCGALICGLAACLPPAALAAGARRILKKRGRSQ